ncbi:hypothetical protein ACQ4PT_037759 [Festuca glaucescens]
MGSSEDVRGDVRHDGSASSIGGKFWCLLSEDDEDDREEEILRSPELYRQSSPEISSSPSARQWNRNYNNNYRGAGRYNNNTNRFQRRFNTSDGSQLDTISQGSGANSHGSGANSQGSGAAQMVASTISGGIETVPGKQQMEEISGMSLSARAQKKVDKMQCLKCGEFGHFADACTAILCLYCELTTHESNDCPLLLMPKPVAVTYGVARNELMFHEVPASAEVTFKHDSGKIGRISVTGGTLSASEIITELQWIIPCNHQWELRPTEDGAFKALFPSKADLARMIKIINVPVPDTNMFLHFEEWSAVDLDKFYLSSVWVRVHGCCYKERCDYLSLFGVGSLIGKTKEVDMAFTRSHTTVRMLVEVTRVEHIPTTTVDHTYGGQGYGLLFKLESQPDKQTDDVDMKEVNPDDDALKDLGKEKEVPNGTNPPFSGAAASAKDPKIDKTLNNTNQSKQVGGSMPVCRVGQIDCPSDEQSWSESKILTLVPRKLWADYVSDDEDSLPSPMPRLSHCEVDLSRSLHEVLDGCSSAFQGGVSGGLTQTFADTAEKPEFFSAVADPPTGSLAEKPGIFPAGATSVSEVHEVTVLPEHQDVLPAATPTALDSLQDSSSAVDAVYKDVRHGQVNGPVSLKGTCDNSVKELENTPISPFIFSSPNVSNPRKGACPVFSVGLESHEHPPRFCTTEHITRAGTGVFLGGRLSVDKVVDFGGISPPSVGARLSQPIKHQRDADATQMERAQNLAKAKDTPNSSGYSFDYSLDPYVIIYSAGGCAPGHGYWVQPVGDGSTGFLQPVRLAY